MKKIIALSAIVLVLLSACNSNKTNNDDSPATPYTPPVGVDGKVIASLKPVIDSYLQLKNALSEDNAKSAAKAGNEITSKLEAVDTADMTSPQRTKYNELADDLKENAEHIGKNADKIDHQREHFEMLSKDIYDLVKVFGGGRHLYQEFCPMYGKSGASWVSESKEIKNPFMGADMLNCGEVKEELK